MRAVGSSGFRCPETGSRPSRLVPTGVRGPGLRFESRLWAIAAVLAALQSACASRPEPGGDLAHHSTGEAAPAPGPQTGPPTPEPSGEALTPTGNQDWSGDPSCIANRGCPDAKPLAPCPLDVVPMPVAEVLAVDPSLLEGHEISVAGSLRLGASGCTVALCRGRCCNRCHGALVLRDDATGRDLRLDPDNDPMFGCLGDDSGLCCPFELGLQVAAVGRLVNVGMSIHGPIWWLASDRLCVMP